MAFVKDKKGKALIEEAVELAEHIIDAGYSRATSIKDTRTKYNDVPLETLETRVSKRNVEKDKGPETEKEKILYKADHTPVLVRR